MRMDASRRQGLSAGDVMAFVRVDEGGGRLMRLLCEAREDEGEEERATWALEDADADADAGAEEERPWESDGACWLEVVRKEKWIGFRSAAAGSRFLQVRRRGRRRLSFFNANFGVWEQCFLDDPGDMARAESCPGRFAKSRVKCPLMCLIESLDI